MQTTKVPTTLKAKLAHVPARGLFVFFVTVLIVGYYHRGYMLAVWLFGWLTFILFKLAFAVKKRVEEKQSELHAHRNGAAN